MKQLGALALTLILSTPLNPGAAAAERVCSADMFAKKCKDLSSESLDLRKSTSEADGVLFNYFLVGKREWASEITDFNRGAASVELTQRANETAKQVRNAAVSYVTADTPEPTWTNEVATVVARLRTVKIRLAEGTDTACVERDYAAIPNSSYDHKSHTINICPGQVKSTTQELAASLAHEIGHSVSPCLMQSTPEIFKTFNACIEKRYKTDYEDWIASTLFHLDKMPKRLDSLPESSAKHIEALKRTVPFRCYIKNTEHFADSFGGMVYSIWGKARNLTPAQFETGIHLLTAVQCIEKTTKSVRMNQLSYPGTPERIGLYLKPRAIANLLACKPKPRDTQCALTEETFTQTK